MDDIPGAHSGVGNDHFSDLRLRMGGQTWEKSRPFQAQSLWLTVAGPHEATGR